MRAARRILNRFVRATLLAVALGAAAALEMAGSAQAQTVVSVSLFYDNLAPHGRWFWHSRWGWSWFPIAVGSDWRPYTRGRWVLTAEYGWYWESEEPWGWAVYHYGRWTYDEEYGWFWVPGTQWGPAWVAFRYGDNYAGWAPLPPETLYVTAPVYSAAYTDLTAAYYSPRWVFVETRYFLAPRIYVYAARPTNNHLYINRTVNVTNYVTVNRVVINRSIEPRRIEAAVGRPLVAVRVQNVTNIPNVTVRNHTTQTNVVNVYRPVVRKSANAGPPPRSLAHPEYKPRIAVHTDAVAPSNRSHTEKSVPTTEKPSPKSATPAPSPSAVPPARSFDKKHTPEYAAPKPPMVKHHLKEPGEAWKYPLPKSATPAPVPNAVPSAPSFDKRHSREYAAPKPPVVERSSKVSEYDARKSAPPKSIASHSPMPAYVPPGRPPLQAPPPPKSVTQGPSPHQSPSVSKPHPASTKTAPSCSQPGQRPCPPR